MSGDILICYVIILKKPNQRIAQPPKVKVRQIRLSKELKLSIKPIKKSKKDVSRKMLEAKKRLK